MNEPFVFAIAYNCGLIARKCLQSYHEHHSLPVHIFCTVDDFKELEYHQNNICVDLGADPYIKHLYNQGHLGTGYIWARVLNREFGDYSHVIQIDSDVIFLHECLSDICVKFDEGYDLVGPRRAYKSMATIPAHLESVGLRNL